MSFDNWKYIYTHIHIMRKKQNKALAKHSLEKYNSDVVLQKKAKGLKPGRG